MKRSWLAIPAAVVQGMLGAFCLWYAWFIAGFAVGFGHPERGRLILATGGLYGTLCLLAGVTILRRMAWGHKLAIVLNLLFTAVGGYVLWDALIVRKRIMLDDIVVLVPAVFAGVLLVFLLLAVGRQPGGSPS